LNIPILHQIVEAAIEWAEQAVQLSNGRSLTEKEANFARRVGVKCPELIRISIVGEIPMPQKDPLRTVALSLGLDHPDGLSLGYCIFLRQNEEASMNGILKHECRHVAQFENFGGVLGPFIAEYLSQIFKHGYLDAPMEVEAMNYQDLE